MSNSAFPRSKFVLFLFSFVLFCALFIPSLTSAYVILWEKPRGINQMGYVLLGYYHTGYPNDWEAAGPVQNLGADLDGDGIKEFVSWIFDASGTYLYVVNAMTGTIEFSHTWEPNDQVQVIAYFDADPSDGYTEVLIETPARTLVISGQPSNGVGSSGTRPGPSIGMKIKPNPTSDNTSIALSLKQDANVTVAIYDVSGRRVRLLLDTAMPSGVYAIDWDGKNDFGVNVSSGMYFARVDAGGEKISKKAVLIR